MTQQQTKLEKEFRPFQWLRATARFIRQKPLGACGAIIVLIFAIIAIFADALAPFDPVETNYRAMMQAPSFDHWMGTDVFGRDILSRIFYGARTAMLIGFSTSFTAATLGTIIGLTSAYQGGRTDLWIQRLMDILLSFPLIVMASAQVIGASSSRIIYHHMLPNVVGPYLIMLTAFLGQAILLEASLSFIGLGVAEPTPAWGLMLKGAAEQFLEQAPWMSIFPGLAISLAVFGFNVFGDALRDVLDRRAPIKKAQPTMVVPFFI